MPARLLASRWDGTLGSEAKQPDTAFGNPEGIGIRWNIYEFGTQRIELIIKARNRDDAYDRYKNHLGQRIGVYSHWAYQPITGFVTSVDMMGANRVRYVAKGPIARMESELDTNVYASATTLGGASGAIATILSNMDTRIDDTTTTNIATNTATLFGTNPQFPEGTKPAKFIKEVLSLSDTSYNIYDFWLVDQPFLGTSTQLWTPYYQPRSSSASIDWQVNQSDIADLRLSRNVDETVTDAHVYYARITATHDGGNNLAYLSDASEDFLAAGITAGDSIINVTDGSRGQVESVTTTTVVPGSMSGGTDNDFDDGDFCSIEMKNVQNASDATTTATYWKNEVAIFERQFIAGHATRYANSLLHPDAVQVQAFTVTSPTIRDGSGGRWPLWEPIAQGGGYIRVNNLFPASSLFSTSQDDLTTFFITSLDYDNATNTLRVGVDSPDKRLDARLRRAGIINSELVNVGAAL